MSSNTQVYILYSISSRSIILVSKVFGQCIKGRGVARPPPFTLSTITSKVVVYAPAERSETLLLFLITLFFSVPSSDSSKRNMSVKYTASSFTNYFNGGALYFCGFLHRILVKHRFRDIFLWYTQMKLNLLRKYFVTYPTPLD
jgi:hypothetical protein